MTILGLDPGLARTGYGLLNTSSPQPYMGCGCLTTPAGLTEAERLVELGASLEQLLTQYSPELAVVEQIFFGRNTKTALMTAQARGVLIYLVKRRGLRLLSLTPLQIKSRLTGFGQATKSQIQNVIKSRLRLDVLPQPDDAADALAAAMCGWDSQADLRGLNLEYSNRHA